MRIKKVSETVPSSAIVNEQTESTINAYSANYINNHFVNKAGDTIDGSLAIKDGAYSKNMKNLPAGTDGREYWNSLEAGTYWYGNTGNVSGMPENYGFVVKTGFAGTSSDWSVMFYQQSNGSIYRRSGNSSSDSGWIRIWQKPKILWDNYYYMNGSQSITFSEPVSKQANGIVLVFCAYSDGQPRNWNWQSHFLSKQTVSILNGAGHSFFMGGTGGIDGFKYIYISDTGMSGNNKNEGNISGQLGTYNNSSYVLRYVIGV